MARLDLLALTTDDLAAMTNRGTVKRAERELEANDPTSTIQEEADGRLSVQWSDGIVCIFPAGKTLHEAQCSSGTLGISRHLIRSVLAYQLMNRNAKSIAPTQDTSNATQGTWDPGTFTDDELAERFRKPAVAVARKRFEQGVLVELTRGDKPTARFLDDPCTIRFLVKGDLRYVTTDCAEPLLATFISMAVWAFRQLPADQTGGLVAFQLTDLPVPVAVLDELEALLRELCQEGLSRVGSSWPARCTRLEANLRAEGLVWPAELLLELYRGREMYAQHDALFDPYEVIRIVGELMTRSRAIRNQTKAVPQLLIRGSRSDRITEMASSRLMGMGTGVRIGRKVTRLQAYMQDVDTGLVVTIERTFADPAPEEKASIKSYHTLGQHVVSRGITLASLGVSQLMLKSGKRTPAGYLQLPRQSAAMTTHLQTFDWETLKPPVLVEDYQQLEARLRSLPPSYLRPCRPAEHFHVCPVQRVEHTTLDTARQTLLAVLEDRHKNRLQLVIPYHHRAQSGFERLATLMKDRQNRVLFVSGQVQRTQQALVIQPVCVVIEEGNTRVGLQPWVDHFAQPTHAGFEPGTHDSKETALQAFLTEVDQELAELLLTGTAHSAPSVSKRWHELSVHGQHLGLVRFVKPLAQLANELEQRSMNPDWKPNSSATMLLELLLMHRVSLDVSS